MEGYLLSGCVVVLLILWGREVAVRKRQEAQLRQIGEKLLEIQDRDSEEHITIFTKYPEI